jgi:hypothetical protein
MATPWLHKSFSVNDARLAMKTSNSKVAIVTGASRGIGAAIARRLGTDGFTVVVNYAGSAEAAESLVREIENAGGRAQAVQADVSDPVAVASWPSLKGESRSFEARSRTWLMNLLTAPSMRDVEPRCLPSVAFTPSGPLVYRWQIDHSAAQDR